MATKKSVKARPQKRKAATRSVPLAIPYGDPIRQAIAQGDRAEMRQAAVSARRWIPSTEKQLADAKKALAKLESVLPKL